MKMKKVLASTLVVCATTFFSGALILPAEANTIVYQCVFPEPKEYIFAEKDLSYTYDTITNKVITSNDKITYINAYLMKDALVLIAGEDNSKGINRVSLTTIDNKTGAAVRSVHYIYSKAPKIGESLIGNCSMK